MRLLQLTSAVLVAGILALQSLAQQPLPPASGVNPVKKGAPNRSGTIPPRPGVTNPKGTVPAAVPQKSAPKQFPAAPAPTATKASNTTPAPAPVPAATTPAANTPAVTTPATTPAATTPAANTPAATTPTATTASIVPDPADAAAVAKFRLQKSYAYGLDISRAIQADEMDFDLAALVQGLSDGLGKKKLTINDEEYAQLMQAITREAEEKAIAKYVRLSEENKKEGEKFLAENAKKEGVVTLATGVQYRIVKSGDGKTPKASDNVQVHLKGMLLNGDQFFSSYSLNQPSTFPVGGVIRGLKDTLLQMKIGDKWQIFIPAEHAFGKEGNVPAARGLPGVGPNELVIYEVELIDIVPEAQE